MAYACIIRWGQKIETICVYGETNDELFDDPDVLYSAPLFTSLCDLMGLDLHQTMLEIMRSERPAETAANYSYLFTDSQFYEAFETLQLSNEAAEQSDFEKLRDSFMWLHYLKAWFVEMETDERLHDAELFRSYAAFYLGTNVPTLYKVDAIDERVYFNPMNPDYSVPIDAFLREISYVTDESIFLAKDYQELLVMELYLLVKNNETVLTCRNCGKKFVAFTRSDTLYCDRPAPQDSHKTCKEYGNYISRLEKVRHDEATHLYKQLYNRLQNRYRRTKTVENPDGNMRLKAETDAFTDAGKVWKIKIKAGAATEPEYIEWLRNTKEELDSGEHSGEKE